MKLHRTLCLVPAGGESRRFGGELPKLYTKIAGIPLLRHTLNALLLHPRIEGIRIIIHPGHRSLYEEATAGLNLLPPVPGGATRQESVRLGLESIAAFSPQYVLIHDAARPFVTPALIDRLLHALGQGHTGAIPALPVEDTLKSCENGKIHHTVDRTSLWRAQTPQGFSFPSLLTAHQKAKGLYFTDDAAINEHYHLPVAIVEGSPLNIKITTREDLSLAGKIMQPSTTSHNTRTGFGIDVHRFVKPHKEKDNHIMLCGVPLPHHKSLEGHSDADAGLHALVDAILGAISQGDIGEHFPPSNPAYKGADSSIFVAHAKKLVDAAGAVILHTDITFICQAPKITPYKKAMQERVASLLNLSPSCVNIKATTTEGLGFTGREEGIAAQAIATILYPG